MLKLTDILDAMHEVDTDVYHYRVRMEAPCTVWREADMFTSDRSNSRSKLVVGSVTVVHYAKPSEVIDDTAWALLQAFMRVGAQCSMSPQYNPETDEVEYWITIAEVLINGPFDQ